METPMLDELPPFQARGFAALHRDLWRVLREAPIVFLVLPAVVWFPIDLAIEFAVSKRQLDVWQELNFFFKLVSDQFLIGSGVASVRRKLPRL